MGSHKKKKHTFAQKKKQAEIQELSLDQLTDKGAGLLNAGKPRDAIPLLKAALKDKGGNEKARDLLFQAYLLRAAHLREKGMVTEADAVQQNAIALIPDPARMNEQELFKFISAATPDASIPACCNYLRTNSPSSKLEQTIAGLLVLTGNWELLNALPEDSGLLVDSAAAQQAVQMMYDGKWEAALERFKPIARSSPYAPARMLCLAMSCFYKKDDAGMNRALAMIPENDPLSFLATILKKDTGRMGCLWDRPIYSESDVAMLMSHLMENHVGQAAAYIRKFSEAVYPENPTTAAREMLLSLWPLALRYELRQNRLRQLAKELLTDDEAKLLMAKLDYYHFEASVIDSARYIEVLETEFPNETPRKKAAALILVHSVEQLENRGIPIPAMRHVPIHTRNQLGINSHRRSIQLIELLSKAIDLYPENHMAYDLLAKLPRHSTEAKDLVEKGLEKMLAVYPEDPFPCLELSELYYQKNAFRKAEKILAEAGLRAPHDIRVADRHVLALLISAEKRIRGNKHHLAAEDLEKAHSLCNDRTLPLVTAKKVRFECEVSGQLSLFSGSVARSPKEWASAASAAIGPLTPYQRLQTLGFLAIDPRLRNRKDPQNYIGQLGKLFQQCRNDISQLTASEISSLLVPMDKMLRPVMPTLLRAGVYLKHYPKLLEKVNGADIAVVLDSLVAEHLFGPAKKEIRRRLKQPAASSGVLMAFYLVVIRHLTGELQDDAGAFEDILQKVLPEEKELLRVASRRISGYASGRLKAALEAFNFGILKRQRSAAFGDLGMMDWEEEDDDDWDMDDDEMVAFPDFLAEMLSGNGKNLPGIPKHETAEMIATVEGIIDESNLRGVPGPVIRSARNEMKKNFPGSWIFDLVSSMLTDAQIKKLSREAREFLFGKN